MHPHISGLWPRSVRAFLRPRLTCGERSSLLPLPLPLPLPLAFLLGLLLLSCRCVPAAQAMVENQRLRAENARANDRVQA
jgi:hypothetical protein